MIVVCVQLHFAHLAEVTITTTTSPRWWRRLFWRERERSTEVTRFAALGGCGHFHWDDTGKLVTDEHVVDALTAAVIVERAMKARDPLAGLGDATRGTPAHN